MLRAIALSLALLLALGTIIPLATDYSEASSKISYKKKKKKKKKLKKYSKAWWRWYHKKMKRKRAIAKRKRALRAKQMLMAKAARKAKAAKLAAANPKAASDMPESTEVKADTPKMADAQPKLKKTSQRLPKVKQKVAAGQDADSGIAYLPSGEVAPQGWKKGKSAGEFSVDDESGKPLGSASLSDVGESKGADAPNNKKTLGGVPTSLLRRTVIDKMVREEGWVVNDFQKEVNGKKVYVVIAQSPSKNGVQSRIFYFTEVNGRIYSLATNAPNDAAERLAKDSERILNSLHRNRPQSAELR